ncbi:PD-(D/E)XK motif protein [Pseudanabaena sp. PCC 6802]|uniref:PD-(D/E)XK motif protein n=1 Tax=Pseudanabaena sp. PCC 6802 TaxID=118173 RepID=UPI00034677B7|nr:PD-(D/E)XK motif protein [Pseudanabaena sp. PCC 6802]
MGKAQDFHFPHCAIEVKTTVTQQPERLTISNEQQLDDSGIETLLLLHLAFDIHSNEDETLPSLVESLRSLLQDFTAAKMAFERSLFHAGYLDIHAPLYASTGYRHLSSSYFRVASGFPRLVPSDLVTGISHVRYAISLNACRPFAIAESEALKILNSQE